MDFTTPILYYTTNLLDGICYSKISSQEDVVRKNLFYIFIVLGFLSLIDNLTGLLLNSGAGLISSVLFIMFESTSVLLEIILIILDLALFWFILAIIFRTKKQKEISK